MQLRAPELRTSVGAAGPALETSRRKIATAGGKISRPVGLIVSRLQDRHIPGSLLARVLRCMNAGLDVFRAAVLSIVLTIATGQEAALICRAWCHPIGRAAAGCAHQDQTTRPGMTSHKDCRDAELGAIAFVREDPRRGATALVQGPVIIPPFALASSPDPRSSGAFLAPLTEAHTLPLVLRI